MIRFHLDENVDGAIARGLRDRGYDVTMPVDVGLLEATDEQQLTFATLGGRVLVTHDSDFLKLHAAGRSHAGIVYCRSNSRTIGQIVRGLLLIAACLDSDEFVDHVEFL